MATTVGPLVAVLACALVGGCAVTAGLTRGEGGDAASAADSAPDAARPDAGKGCARRVASEPGRRDALYAGNRDTCLLSAAGEVLCWGSVPHYWRRDASVPAALPLPGDVVQLALGCGHACARRAGGSVLCWGINESGEVGDGTASRPTSPARPASVVRWLNDATAVTAGARRTCALRATGEVLCWGDSAVGALGADRSAADFPNPVAVTGLRDAVSLASASQHSCAARAQGDVVCWGINNAGQLGDSVTRHAGCPWPRPFVWDCSPAPVPVEPPCDVEELALGSPCGGNHACARRGSGTVLCWGRNAEGQLGDGTREPRWAPVPVVGVTDAVELAAGGLHTCARRATGAVLCWGRNAEGQLGDGTLVDRVTPVAVAGLDDATEIAAGELHTCARRRVGGVVCWGNNQAGQLGDGALLHRACSIHGDCNPTPVAVVGLP